MNVNTSVEIAGVVLKNPVIAASGTYGFGREYSGYVDLNRIGGISVKGLTLKPRKGNPTPRIAETPSGILNSVGLQNPGVEAFIRDEIPFLRQYSTKIIANIAGETIDDYAQTAQMLDKEDVDIIEVNISCPNVKKGCISFGSDSYGTKEVTSAVRQNTKKPVMVKLTPNTGDIAAIAAAAESGGADAVSLINTITGMVVDVNTGRPVLCNNTGGLSGPAVRPVAVRMVHEVFKSVSIPVVGMGGITCAEDALQFIIAGARAVMVGTWNFNNPEACVQIAEGIETHLKNRGIADMGKITGSLILNG
jgi:dihydroorotate dehydrogenase (NAD+) catalytic subunit